MLIYLTDDYNQNKCIVCGKPVNIYFILHSHYLYWVEEYFYIPKTQSCYGYCSEKCSHSLDHLTMKQSVEVVSKIVNWRLK